MELDINFLLARLNTTIDNTQYSIRRHEENTIKKDLLDKKYEEEQRAISVAMVTDDSLKTIEKNLLAYNANKQEKALAAIYSAIHSARSIIPDSSPVQLSISRETAMLVTDSGEEVNLTEGSAFRAMISFFTRGVVQDNTEYETFNIYDEPFATVSPENSVELSNFLRIWGKRRQLILIEQKKEVFANIEDNITTFYFKKTEGATQITKIN